MPVSWVTVNSLSSSCSIQNPGGPFVLRISPSSTQDWLFISTESGGYAFIPVADNRIPGPTFVNLVYFLKDDIKRHGKMEKDGKVGYFNARFRGSDGKLEIDLSSRLDGW